MRSPSGTPLEASRADPKGLASATLDLMLFFPRESLVKLEREAFLDPPALW